VYGWFFIVQFIIVEYSSTHTCICLHNGNILLFAYHIGMVRYTTSFQNMIYVADKTPSSYQSAKSEEPMTLEIG